MTVTQEKNRSNQNTQKRSNILTRSKYGRRIINRIANTKKDLKLETTKTYDHDWYKVNEKRKKNILKL